MSTQRGTLRQWIVMILIGIGSLIALFGCSDAPATPEQQPVAQQPTVTTSAPESTDAPAPAPEPTAVPQPTAVPTPQPTLTPLDAIAARIKESPHILDEDAGHVSVQETAPGALLIQFPVSFDYFASTRLWLTVGEIIQTAYESDYPVDYLRLQGTADLVDQYGNVQRGEVMRLGMPRALYERINWQHYKDTNYKQLPDVSEDVYVHPDLQE